MPLGVREPDLTRQLAAARALVREYFEHRPVPAEDMLVELADVMGIERPDKKGLKFGD